MNDDVEDAMKRAADLLVERGFATGYTINRNTRINVIMFTPAGKIFHDNLRALFDVPRTHPSQITQNQITDMIALLLFIP